MVGAVAWTLRHWRRPPPGTFTTVFPAWFAVYHAVWGLGWAPELWTGSIALAALTVWGLSLLVTPPSPPASWREPALEEGLPQVSDVPSR